MKQIDNTLHVFSVNNFDDHVYCIKQNFCKHISSKADTMPTGNYTDVNGIKMYYAIHGSGRGFK